MKKPQPSPARVTKSKSKGISIETLVQKEAIKHETHITIHSQHAQKKTQEFAMGGKIETIEKNLFFHRNLPHRNRPEIAYQIPTTTP